MSYFVVTSSPQWDSEWTATTDIKDTNSIASQTNSVQWGQNTDGSVSVLLNATIDYDNTKFFVVGDWLRQVGIYTMLPNGFTPTGFSMYLYPMDGQSSIYVSDKPTETPYVSVNAPASNPNQLNIVFKDSFGPVLLDTVHSSVQYPAVTTALQNNINTGQPYKVSMYFTIPRASIVTLNLNPSVSEKYMRHHNESSGFMMLLVIIALIFLLRKKRR